MQSLSLLRLVVEQAALAEERQRVLSLEERYKDAQRLLSGGRTSRRELEPERGADVEVDADMEVERERERELAVKGVEGGSEASASEAWETTRRAEARVADLELEVGAIPLWSRGGRGRSTSSHTSPPHPTPSHPTTPCLSWAGDARRS